MAHDCIWTGPAILHVDLDAFFAWVEQLDHPEWRGKPVIVGGSPEGRGVVSTASYEARRFGVKSAMASARAVRLCPDAIWAHPRFERYQELSQQVRRIFESATPRVQPVSIDEAYLDVTPGASGEDPVDVARRIQSAVDELGLSCSVGVATSKVVAKIASDMDKPHGLTVVPSGQEAAFLSPLPIRAMPGIGPRSAERLATFGVHTLGELAALDDSTARHLMGSHGPEAVHRARGIDVRTVHGNDPVKSVSNERTFADDLREPAFVDKELVKLAQKVADRLHARGIAGRTVTVKVRFADFTTRSAQRTEAEPISSATKIVEAARELLAQLWTPGVGVRLLGVGVSHISAPGVQLGMLDEEGDSANRDDASQRLNEAVDSVRDRFGQAAVVRGSRLKRRTEAE